MYDPVLGWLDDGFGVLGGFAPDADAQADIGLFNHVQNDGYFTALRFDSHVVLFNAEVGAQVYQSLLDADGFKAWAVRDGDVAAVPEPSLLALLALGMVGLFIGRQRQAEDNDLPRLHGA